jgi:hypothetical protein
MRYTKVLLPLNENERTQNLSQIAIQIFKKLVDMRLNNENSFDEFLSNLQLNENTYLFTL